MYLSGLDGKGVEAILAQQAAELQLAYDKASRPEATQEDIDLANKLNDEYAIAMQRYTQGVFKKKKTLVGKLKLAQEKKIKIFSKISPSLKAHAQHIDREKNIQAAKISIMNLQGQKPSEQRNKELESLNARLQQLAKKEKTYLKQGKIAALIASIVIGIFTFGGGSVAVQGAYQALKQGAVEIAKKLLLGAVGTAIVKGASAADAKKAEQAANDLALYPPDPNLTSLELMINDSQMKKELAAENRQKIIWTGTAIGAALLLLS
jgi:hypothetical protein